MWVDIGGVGGHGWCFSCCLGAVWNSWNLPSAGDSEVFIVFQGCASNAAHSFIRTCTQKTPSRIFCVREGMEECAQSQYRPVIGVIQNGIQTWDTRAVSLCIPVVKGRYTLNTVLVSSRVGYAGILPCTYVMKARRGHPMRMDVVGSFSL